MIQPPSSTGALRDPRRLGSGTAIRVRRPRRGVVALALALAGAALLAVSIAVALTPQTTDFICFWTGSRFWLEGQDPYDTAAWSAAMGGEYRSAFGNVRAPFCPGRFGYPLTTAIALAPLGALPLELAAILWEALLLAAAVAGTVLFWRALEGPAEWTGYLVLLTIGSQPLWNTAINAQFGGLLLGAIGAAAYAIARGRFVQSGVAASLFLLKPHLLAPVALVALSLRRGRLVASAALCVAAAVALSLIAQPDWIAEWLAEIAGSRLDMAATATTTWSLAEYAFGARAWALVPIVLFMLLAVPLMRPAALSVVEAIATVAALVLVATPYAGSHDHLLLVPAWAVILHRALPTRHATFALALLPALVLVLPWVLWSTSSGEVRSALVPLAASSMLLVILHATAVPPTRRAATQAPSSPRGGAPVREIVERVRRHGGRT